MGELRIISNTHEPFADRVEAGQMLARQLEPLADSHPLVLAIPRGGVVVGYELAEGLRADLDIILTRKLPAPGNPELAIGAVAENGNVVLNHELLSYIGVGPQYIEANRRACLDELARRGSIYRQGRPPASIARRMAIITDDGVATGSTLEAAIQAARQENPSRLIVALPVGPQDTLQRLAGLCDELLCLRMPAMFHAVGQFYRNFDQTSDEEVLELLMRRPSLATGKT